MTATQEASTPGEKRKGGRPRKHQSQEEADLAIRESKKASRKRQELRQRWLTNHPHSQPFEFMLDPHCTRPSEPAAPSSPPESLDQMPPTAAQEQASPPTPPPPPPPPMSRLEEDDHDQYENISPKDMEGTTVQTKPKGRPRKHHTVEDARRAMRESTRKSRQRQRLRQEWLLTHPHSQPYSQPLEFMLDPHCTKQPLPPSPSSGLEESPIAAAAAGEAGPAPGPAPGSPAAAPVQQGTNADGTAAAVVVDRKTMASEIIKAEVITEKKQAEPIKTPAPKRRRVTKSQKLVAPAKVVQVQPYPISQTQDDDDIKVQKIERPRRATKRENAISTTVSFTKEQQELLEASDALFHMFYSRAYQPYHG